MSWLQQHIEEFVEPVLGSTQYYESLGYFSSQEVTVIKNAWRSIKRSADGKPILLPGRDVFIFEILARRENYPTLFVPECSRQTVRAMKSHIPCIEDYFLFDTGFAGSIPRNLGVENFKLLSTHIANNGMQVFPRLTFSRSLALKIESTPKYWESGRIGFDGKIIQPISKVEEFAKAAKLTIEIYKNSSPKFIPKHKPLTLGR